MVLRSGKIPALCSIPLFLGAIAVLVILDPPAVFEPPFLLAFLNTVFLGIIPLVIAYFAARVYQKNGSAGLLVAGAGILIFGLGSIVAGWVNPLPGGPNMTVTIHNTCACISGALILAGVVLGRTGFSDIRRPGSAGRTAALYTGTVLLVLVVSLTTIRGLTPPFFVPGTGPTAIRQAVLEAAVLFFGFASLLFMNSYHARKSEYVFWNAVAITLIAIGLLAIFFQPSVGSLIGWVGRTAQYLGCVLGLYAVFLARKASLAREMPVEDIIANFYSDAEGRGYLSNQILDTVADGVALIRAGDGIIVSTNPWFDLILGFERGELVGKEISVLNAPAGGSDPWIAEGEIQRRLRESGEWHGEMFNRKKDGTGIWCLAGVSTFDHPVFGTVWVLTQTDITERRKMEAALAESERKFREIFENSDMGIAHTTPDGRILRANTSFARIFGYSGPEEFLHEVKIGKCYPAPEDREGLLRILDEKGIVRNFETQYVRRDGTPFWGSVTARAIRNTSGSVILYEGTILDITERRQAIDALAESESKYRALFSAESDAIFVVDKETGIITDCNDAVTTMYGYRKDEVIGQSNTAVSAEPDATRAATQDVKGLIPVRHHKRRDGYVFPVEITANVVSVRGRDVIIAAVRNITERKKAEDSLRQISRKLNLLSSITRHDINNQLTILIGYLRRLEKKQEDSTQKEYFRKISTAAQRIASMIQFTGDYEKIGVNAPAWQDFRALVDSAAQEAPLGAITIKNDLPAGAEVFADPLIIKVFYNLMENAARYGGKITTIQFFTEEREGNRIIVCEDDGGGVPAEEKERIFDRDVGKNTGLGLYLAREILSITGITIREAGEAGKGARFEMTVPSEGYRTKNGR